MFFEARIGDRYESRGLDVVWTPRGGDHRHGPDTEWIKALRGGKQERNALEKSRAAKRRRAKRGELNGRLYNVSVSGAGVVAESDERCTIGSGVTVELEPGNFFDARIRRVEEVEESGSTYYGLEYMHVSDDYRAWMYEISVAHRGVHAMTPATMLDHGGLQTDPAGRPETTAGDDGEEAPRTAEEEADLARRHERCRELATAFLPDPVYEVAADGSSVEIPGSARHAQPLGSAPQTEDLPYQTDDAEKAPSEKPTEKKRKGRGRRRTRDENRDREAVRASAAADTEQTE